MNIAVIDLGTNTFNLLIVKVNNNKYERIFNTKISVKLGEGGITNKFITPAAQMRAIAAMQQYKDLLRSYNVKKVVATATSAIREASNGLDLVKKVRDETGIEIEVIDGNMEAEYIYYGVRAAVPMTEYPSLIMDIGGGSTEFIIGTKYQIIYKQSFLLGVSRLLELFRPSDPILPEEIILVEKHLNDTLFGLIGEIEKHKPLELIGSSGSFDTFAEVISRKKNQIFDTEKQTTFEFDLKDFYETNEFLLQSTLQQRLTTPGIIPMRADMIVLGSILVNFVLKNAEIQKMRLSTYSLKEGVLDRILTT